MNKLLGALKSADGDYEIQRTLGALGTITYIVTVPLLIWLDKITVTLTEFCLAYPSGLGACVLTTAGSIALKDRQIAKAKKEELPGG
jgi:hypothetical protein